MKIRHYLYNAFIIEEGDKKIAIDPGQNLWMFNKKSLIPKSEWHGITHIFITHGDPDHFVYALPMAKISGADVICGQALKEDFVSQNIKKIYALNVGDIVEPTGLKVEGIKAKHGPLPIQMLGGLVYIKGEVKESDKGGQEIYLAGFRIQKIENSMQVFSHGTIKLLFGLIRLEKDNLDFSRGSIGFKISINSKSIVILGDTLLLNEWTGLQPDVLMIPIGGGKVPNTMDVEAALDAVQLISPKLVIPCHYNVPYGFIKNVNPTDDTYFKSEVEKLGIQCKIMNNEDEIIV